MILGDNLTLFVNHILIRMHVSKKGLQLDDDDLEIPLFTRKKIKEKLEHYYAISRSVKNKRRDLSRHIGS